MRTVVISITAVAVLMWLLTLYVFYNHHRYEAVISQSGALLTDKNTGTVWLIRGSGLELLHPTEPNTVAAQAEPEPKPPVDTAQVDLRTIWKP